MAAGEVDVVVIGSGFGGSKGGKLVFAGPPAALARSKTSITARYLRGD